ncbi:prepilin-type N-terminal cleavage/methylation domain-containing protein [Patescibacteria group bacterium]|nr:prepilin-type N-terminal cleavage/methylation domain-containing protein [Patescibacteria group bacterium]
MNTSRPNGFTLVEALVVVSLTAIMSMAIASLIVMFYRTSGFTLENTKAINIARQGVEQAVRDIREATYGNDGSYLITSAGTSTIVMYSQADADAQVERVTYTLSNGTLYRSTAEPSGNPLSYTNPTYSTTTVSQSVTNGTSTPLFQYYDTTSTEIFPPLNVTSISSVKITLIIDINTNATPLPFTLTGWAHLRNLP